MAIDAFVDASRGFFGEELLAFYIDQGVMDTDNNGEQEEGVGQNGEQATAHHAFTFELPMRPASFAEASASYDAAPGSAMSAPRPAPACVESPEYDSDEFAAVSGSEDEEEEGEMGPWLPACRPWRWMKMGTWPWGSRRARLGEEEEDVKGGFCLWVWTRHEVRRFDWEARRLGWVYPVWFRCSDIFFWEGICFCSWDGGSLGRLLGLGGGLFCLVGLES